jgi:membrane peptidoglycan carboxypeptidase
VTGAAALDRGRYAPTSRIAGPSPLTVDGVPLRNELNQSYGWLTLTQALSLSVDTVFAHVGETVGRRTMSSYRVRPGQRSEDRDRGDAQRRERWLRRYRGGADRRQGEPELLGRP